MVRLQSLPATIQAGKQWAKLHEQDLCGTENCIYCTQGIKPESLVFEGRRVLCNYGLLSSLVVHDTSMMHDSVQCSIFRVTKVLSEQLVTAQISWKLQQ